MSRCGNVSERVPAVEYVDKGVSSKIRKVSMFAFGVWKLPLRALPVVAWLFFSWMFVDFGSVSYAARCELHVRTVAVHAPVTGRRGFEAVLQTCTGAFELEALVDASEVSAG